MRRVRATAFVFIALGMITGCLGRRGDINVTSVFPEDEVEDAFSVIRVRFDKPVVPEISVGEELKALPYRIEPALETAAHYADRETLVIKPLEAMSPATRYTVTLGTPLSQRLTEDVEFSFVRLPLAVKGLYGVDADQTATAPEIAIVFNQPVPAKQVLEGCVLSSAESLHQPGIALSDPEAEGTRIPFTPKEALKKGEKYSFKCEGLRPRPNAVPLEKPFIEKFRVHPTLSVVSFAPKGFSVTPDDLTMSIAFSTPVSEEELKSHVRIAPHEEHFAGGWQRKNNLVYVQSVNVKASTDITVTLEKGLKDEYGQVLEKTQQFRFTTTDAAPSFHMETGATAIEAETDFTLWSRNVKAVDVTCAPVPKAKIVSVLTGNINYNPWYASGENEDEILNWRGFGLKKKAVRLSIEDAKNKWHLSRLDLPAMCGGTGSRGLYLAEFRSDDVEEVKKERGGTYPNRLLGNVTDLGVLVKAGPASGLVWVTSLATGEPVSGASVTLYNMKGKPVFKGASDARGLVSTPGSTALLGHKVEGTEAYEEEEHYGYDYDDDQRIIAVVEKAGDLAVVDGNWEEGIQLWNFNVDADRAVGTTRIRGFIQSDRGIYRPGETVHFKGLVREIAIGKLPAVPEDTSVKVHVEDTSGASVMEKRLTLSGFGGFQFDLTLDEEASLGDYYVTATVEEQTLREQFAVEAFRPVAFEITERNEKQVRVGDRIKLDFTASYLFGQPVKEADVSWSVTKQRHHIRFPKYGDFTFTDNADDEYWYPWYEEDEYEDYDFVADGEETTDKKGHVHFTVKTKAKKSEYPERYQITTSVTDSTDQTVTKRIAVFAHHSDFYLGLHTKQWVQEAKVPFAIKTVALSPTGAPVETDATLTLIRTWWKCKRTKGWYSDCEQKETTIENRPLHISKTAVTEEIVTAELPGDYILRLEGKDGRGKKVVASTSTWVVGKGAAYWREDESVTERMSIVPSKESYRPGETATLVPRVNTENATLLVTLERNGVLDAFIATPNETTGGIEIPITDLHAPNVYATVTLVRGRAKEGEAQGPRFKLGIADLKVSSETHRLRVVVETDREDYEPGDPVTGKIRVVGSDGAPVRAEVSLSVADEGILQLINYQTPDPMKAFYASWGLGVENSTNWNRLARLLDPNFIETEDGADDGGEEEERVRSRFVSSAFWAPALVTDENGEAPFEFVSPDNLTAFRLMAVAADTGSRFGSGDRRIRVNKKLLAKPVLPRFFGQEDKTHIGVVVHNYSDADGEAEVTCEVEGLWIRDKTKKVTVKKGESRRVDFKAQVGRRKDALVRFKVKMGKYFDGFEKRLPVRRPIVTESVTAGEGKGTTAQIPLEWSDDIIGKESEVMVVVDRTGLASLEASLRYLVQYPYGCLEQTLSKLVPLFKVKDLATSLRIEGLRGPKLRAYIRIGVSKILKHQHYNGHFSLWPDSETDPHYTAYALWGLGEARRAKVKVSREAMNRGLDALSKWVNSVDRKLTPGGETATMAMSAFVLADNGRPDSGLNTRLFEARGALPTYGKAFLLRALLRAKAPADQLETLKGEILAQVRENGETAVIKEEGTGLYRYWSSDIRTSAIALTAFLELDRELPVIRKLVEGLKKGRSRDGRWGNTQENLYALVAIAEFARSEARTKTAVTLTLDGKQLVKKTLKGPEVLRWRRSLKWLKGGTLALTSDEPVAYRVALRLARTADQSAPVSQGFSVDREYFDFETDRPVERVKRGQLVKVKLTVHNTEERYFVALVDPLPAGCEAVNSRFDTEVTSDEAEAVGWDHLELHDDRVMAFTDKLWRDATITYLMRATIPGEFTVAPTHVEEMYTPDVYGRTAARRLVVQ